MITVVTDPIRDAFTSTVTLDATPSRVFAAFFALSEIPAHDVAHLQGSTRLQLNGLAAVLADGSAPAAPPSQPNEEPR